MLHFSKIVKNNILPHLYKRCMSHIKIVEVGPRDGLQNYPKFIKTKKKKRLIDLLVKSGIKNIEATSFVPKNIIPQMKDNFKIMKHVSKINSVNFSALVPTMKGYHNAIDSGTKEIAIFTTVSETFCQKNIKCSIEESLTRYKEICHQARKDKIKVRGYISCIAGCPYEKEILPYHVLDLS